MRQQKPAAPLALSLAVFWAIALPSGLVQAAEVDGDKLTVHWDPNDPSEGVTGYELHYDLRSGPPYLGTFAEEGPSPIMIPVETIENPQDPSFTLTGMPPCSTIFVRMKAYNEVGTSDFTEEVSVTVAHKPENVLASPLSEHEVQVSWDAPPPGFAQTISRYLVYYDMAPTDTPSSELAFRYMIEVLPSALSNPAAPSMVLEGLLPGMRVNVAVAATCLGGENDLSEPTATQTPGQSGGLAGPGGLPTDDLRGGCGVGGSGGGIALLLLLALFWRRRN